MPHTLNPISVSTPQASNFGFSDLVNEGP